jgi:hypothetical protein
LFHKDKDVRLKVVDLLERISVHEAGRHWWGRLSRFEKLAWVRIRREAEQEMLLKLGGKGIGEGIGSLSIGQVVEGRRIS